MTLEQWAVKEMKRVGLYVAERNFDPHWCKAYKYTRGKGLQVMKCYSESQ